MVGSRVLTVAALLLGLPHAGGLEGAAWQDRGSKPGAVPAPVRNACDVADAIVAGTPGVSIRRRAGAFRDETLRGAVSGCGLVISGSFTQAAAGGGASERLRAGFAARQWDEMPAYSADGKDGTSFAVRKGDVSCLTRGTWNGGSDGEPAAPAEDWYTITLFCTSPAFPNARFVRGRPR